VLWNQAVHTDREVTANRPDIIIKNKQKKKHASGKEATVQKKMATHVSLAYLLGIENIQSYHKLNAKSVEVSCEYGKELLSESSKSVELEKLEGDLSELLHIRRIAERPSVKEVIQMGIELILAKIESLKDIFKELFETKVSWNKVAAMKHKKYNHNEQRVADTFSSTSNPYNLRCNDSEGDDTQ
jgi:GH24 family phage-related lysozyme (muramidase)